MLSHLGSVLQAPKQLVSGFAQSLTYGIPTAVKASKMIMNNEVPDSFWENHAPGLALRKRDFERFYLSETGNKSFRQSGRLKNMAMDISRKPLALGDNAAARIVFLSSFLSQGGDLQNPDPKILAKAKTQQEMLQGPNSSGQAPTVFNSKDPTWRAITRMMFSYAQFPLSQTLTFLLSTGMLGNQRTKSKANTARVALSIISFHTLSQAIRETFSDDEDDEPSATPEPDQNVMDFTRKVMIRSAYDLVFGWNPIGRSHIESSFEWLNKKLAEKYGDGYTMKDRVFYPNSSELESQLGAILGSVAGDIWTTLAMAVELMEKGESEYAEVLFWQAAYTANQFIQALPLRGDINSRLIRPQLKKAKEDLKAYKEAQKLMQGGKKTTK
jgi:hypothetical protein